MHEKLQHYFIQINKHLLLFSNDKITTSDVIGNMIKTLNYKK